MLLSPGTYRVPGTVPGTFYTIPLKAPTSGPARQEPRAAHRAAEVPGTCLRPQQSQGLSPMVSLMVTLWAALPGQ